MHTRYDPRNVTEHAKRRSLTGIPERRDASGISATCDYPRRSQGASRWQSVLKELHKCCRYILHFSALMGLRPLRR